MLVNKCIMYDKDSGARSAHYKSASEKKSGDKFCGKQYLTPTDKEKHKFPYKCIGGKDISEGGAFNPMKCFKCR